MNPERWKRVKELHARALELPEDQRRGFLVAECGSDVETLREVMSLLAAVAAEDAFLITPNEPIEPWQEVPPPEQLGDFELGEQIGRGGMGVVFLARQVSLDRQVAVKVLPRHSALEQRHVDRFQREARAVAKLEHQHIVPIYFVGEEEGTHYFAMQHIAGHDLHYELRILRGDEEGIEPILPAHDSRAYIPAIARVVAAVADALEYAHQRGVVHRDVKPRNILLDPTGHPHLVDFGLAKVEDLGSISHQGDVAGTYEYMSPEQALAKRVPVDHRTDIFSLGVVLYEMLTLQRPFQGETSHEVLYKISFVEPRWIRRLNPRVPRDLDTICQKAISKRPDNRYGTAAELAEDLRRFLDHEAIRARRPSTITRVINHVLRRRARYFPAAAAILAVCLGLFVKSTWDMQRRIDDIRAFVEADDLGNRPIDELVVALSEARALDYQPAIDAIREIGLQRKRDGIQKLEQGVAQPIGTPPEVYRPASDPDYFAGLVLLREAQQLLPEDEEVVELADPRSTYPRIEIVADASLDGAVVHTQIVDWVTHELAPRVSHGPLPLAGPIALEPAVYRITIVRERDDGTIDYCEITRDVVHRGRLYPIEPTLRSTAQVTAGMVLIPAGEYRVGNPRSPMSLQFHERTMEIPSFWIDPTEVTNAEYRAFVLATGAAEPYYWMGRYDEAWDDYPVLGVTFAQAQAYARWAGKRLPTHYEWEVAARGPDAFFYPWGQEAGDLTSRAVVGRPKVPDDETWEGFLRYAARVGTTPDDRSPFEVFDMLGNVREWTETISAGRTADGDPYPEYADRIAKGFNWDFNALDFTSQLYEVTVCPTWDGRGQGFRCAKTIWSQ